MSRRRDVTSRSDRRASGRRQGTGRRAGLGRAGLVAPRRSATMKDIAEHVGVSKMTVSKVLGQTSSNVGVSDNTRARILAVARQMKYGPNAIARSLRSKQTNIVGLYSGYHFVDPRNPFLAEIVGGLQEGCAEH